MVLTVLMELKGIQREGSTMSHSPERLQLRTIVVVVLGQERVCMVPAGVSGHKRNSVTSASQKPISVGMWSGVWIIKMEGKSV